MASYLMVMCEIQVLVVDYDSEMAILLERCQYRVTRVELASTGIRLLLSGKTKFDVVMMDINSTDPQGFNLLKEAVNMNIPLILMSVEDNAFMAAKAIENGAFLHIQKPTTVEMLKYLWQHIMREKTHMISERDCLMPNNPSNIGNYSTLMLKEKAESNNNVRERKSVNCDEEFDSNKHLVVTDQTKRKASIKWTQELHQKFIDAVEQLGEGRCFPKDILELMNVPGLTKMQVASHLQRCRDNKWPSGKGQTSKLGIQPRHSSTNLTKHMPRYYGSMPQLSKAQLDHVDTQEPIGAETEMRDYGVLENMTIEPIMTNTSRHEQYGSLAPYPSIATSGINSSNPMQQPDGLSNFQGMDSVISSFFDFSQGPTLMHNPNSSYGDYHLDAIYNEQDSTLPRMDTMTNWNSQTSDFGCDDLQNRSQYKY